jgi:hypothetical protein
MVRAVVSFDGAFYDNITKDVNNLDRDFRAEFNRKSRNPIRNLRRRVNKVPSKFPAHPFIWSFDQGAQGRARRWWFAAIAGRIPGVHIETQGGRYKRKGFKVTITFDRPVGTIAAEFPSKGLRFVIWTQQVPSHKRTGWVRVDKELERAEVEFLDNAIKVWDSVTSKVGTR